MIQLELILIAHIVVTLLMTGIIWVIQLVHYPSFMFIEKTKFVKFETFHSKQISKVVIPLMLVELVTSVLLIYTAEYTNPIIIINFLLLISIWLITFFFSAQYHKKLMDGFNELYILKLVNSNWARTALWSTRSAILLFLLLKWQEI